MKRVCEFSPKFIECASSLYSDNKQQLISVVFMMQWDARQQQMLGRVIIISNWAVADDLCMLTHCY